MGILDCLAVCSNSNSLIYLPYIRWAFYIIHKPQKYSQSFLDNPGDANNVANMFEICLKLKSLKTIYP